MRVAVVGGGPAGLMAADQLIELSQGRFEVHLFEKRASSGRKLLVAGSSGLNITYDCEPSEFAAFYSDPERLRPSLEAFTPEDWREFIAKNLGIKVFRGSSRRWFAARESEAGGPDAPAQAASLLKAWVTRLEKAGVKIHATSELSDFAVTEDGVELSFGPGESERFEAACLSLGGGSWEPNEKPLRWPGIFLRKNIPFAEFSPSNVGYRVDWPEALIEEAEGKPIKNVVLSSKRGSRAGDLLLTRYGLEGTPVYFAGETGEVSIDLKPDLSLDAVVARLRDSKENLSVIRRVDQKLNLGEAAFAMVFHYGKRKHPAAFSSVEEAAKLIKAFKISLLAPQSLDEAISSSGGVKWQALNESGMLASHPGIFLAGEMIDWDAPTGGFLIQACVSQGARAAREIVRFLTAE